jgi:hypothetical protein
MRYRRFGRTDWEVSEIGYGMWGMGGWSGSDDTESLQSLQRAVDLGCNFFDTAYVYGEGRSEHLLGQLVRANPERKLYLATKIPLKIWGAAGADGIAPANGPRIKAKCVRVAVLDGHTAYVTAKFKTAPTVAQILERWERHALSRELPSAPRRLIHYRTEPDRPQPQLDVMTENGMAVTIGQLSVDREDGTVSFTALAHNAILGAAGGALWATEAAVARGLVYRRA